MVPQRNLACTLQSRQAKGANQSTMKNPIGFKVMKWLVHVFNDALKAQRTHQQRDGKTRDQFGEIFRSKNKISNVLPNYFSIMLSKKFFVIKKPLDQFTTCSLWGQTKWTSTNNYDGQSKWAVCSVKLQGSGNLKLVQFCAQTCQIKYMAITIFPLSHLCDTCFLGQDMAKLQVIEDMTLDRRVWTMRTWVEGQQIVECFLAF